MWYIIDTPREIKPRSRNSRQPVQNNRKSRNEERKESRTIMVIEEPGQIWQDGTCRWIPEITFSQQDDFLNAKGQAGTQDSKWIKWTGWSGISRIDGSEKTAGRRRMIPKEPVATVKNQTATPKKVLDFRNKIQIARRSHPCPTSSFYKKTESGFDPDGSYQKRLKHRLMWGNWYFSLVWSKSDASVLNHFAPRK